MKEEWKSRTELLIGKDNMQKLANAKVIVYGIGGVGSFAVEGLVRAGIGNIILADKDVVSPSNLNRQIHATIPNIGKLKIDCMKERILTINPNIKIETYLPQDIKDGEETLINNKIDYVIDAVDTVTTKIKLIEKATVEKIPIISCMGTGNKLDPTKFEITDIYKTSICPLAKVMRKELKKRGIQNLKVLYSKEEPIKHELESRTPASISFVPSVAGMIIAGEVIKDIMKNQKLKEIS